jgi:hypothetical protein
MSRNSSHQTGESSQESMDQANQLNSKSDQELNDMLDKDQYFFERFQIKMKKRRSQVEHVNSQQLLLRNIHSVIKYYYRNPLSLKEIARIKIRQHLLKIDFKLKFKIVNQINLPKCLKNYLLLTEYNF